MIKKVLARLRLRLRPLAVAFAALALVATTTSAMTATAWADGPTQTKKATSRASRTPAKRSPFVTKPAITGVVNLNTATAAELQKLPGIGPSKAKRIIAYRAKKGPFRRIRDLRRVTGIGRKTLRKMSDHLTIKGPTTAK